MSNDPIFVIGIARSGTTYLAKCLNDAGIGMWAGGGKPPFAEDVPLKHIITEERNTNGLDLIKNYKPSKEFLNNLAIWGLKREKDSNGGLWGAKEPRIIGYLSAFSKLFPDAKYICCVRNLVNTALSQAELYKTPTCFLDLVKTNAGLLTLLTPNVHIFNYDGNIQEEEEKLNYFLNLDVTVDISSKWAKRR